MEPGNRCSALVVDDDEPTRRLIASFISQDLPGTQVALAGTCEAALALANRYTYDVILLDLLMPGMGGYEVLSRIRTGSMNRSTPVVIVSVLGADPEAIERCRSLGADKIVGKPVNRSSLAATVRAQLAAAKAER